MDEGFTNDSGTFPLGMGASVFDTFMAAVSQDGMGTLTDPEYHGLGQDTTIGDGTERGVLSLPPSTGQSILVKGGNGAVRWVTMQEDDPMDDLDDGSVSFGHMVRRATQGITLGALEDELEKSAKVAAQPSTAPSSSAGVSRELFTTDSLKADALWVQKYTPKQFVELLSDEEVNLSLLRWLKAWEPYVFPHSRKKQQPEPTGPVAPPMDRIALLTGPPGVGKTTLAHVVANHCGYEVVEINASVDRSAKSLEGLLASAVAETTVPKSCLPRPVTRATERDSQLQLLRPKCLIIDEMDGIVANVVPLLLHKLDIRRPVICLANDLYAPVLRELRQNLNFQQQMPAIQPTKLLSRLEVIVQKEKCQVNRMILSELCHMSGGDVRSCLNNLQLLCALGDSGKGIVGMSAALAKMKLKDSTMNLWTLWKEILSRKEKSAYFKALSGAADAPPTGAAGPGDLKVTDRRDLLPVIGSKMDPGYVYILKLFETTTEYDTLLDGLFQYFSQQAYADYNFHRTANCTQCFSFHDRVATSAYETQSFSLLSELSKFTAAQVHPRCSTLQKTKSVQFPRESFNMNQKLKSNNVAVRSVVESNAKLATFSPPSVFTTDTAGYLLPLLLPQFKLSVTFSSGALSGKDLELFNECVERHFELGLTYRKKMQQYDPNRAGAGGSGPSATSNPNSGARPTPSSSQPSGGEGTGNTPGNRADQPGEMKRTELWVLDPEIEDVVSATPKATENSFVLGFSAFGKKKVDYTHSLSRRKYWIRSDLKEAIANAIVKLRIQRSSESSRREHDHHTGPATSSSTATKEDAPKDRTGRAVAKVAPPSGPVETVRRDFFGRPILTTAPPAGKKRPRSPVPATGTVGESAGNEVESTSTAHRRWIGKYNHLDGATNEVRRDSTAVDWV